MHILLGAIIGCVVSVALTFIASRVIDRPLTWKDITASAVAGIVGGAIATATLGVGAATAARTVVAFSAGGATGSAGGQVTDNVLHGHEVQKDLVKSTALGTVIGAATFGAGKAVAPLARHAGSVFRHGARSVSSTAGSAGHGAHGNPLAGAAAGLDDAIVPVYRYVKNALARDPVGSESEHDTESPAPVVELAEEGGALGRLNALTEEAAEEVEPAQATAEDEIEQSSFFSRLGARK